MTGEGGSSRCPAYIAAARRPAQPRGLACDACFKFREGARGGLYCWEFEGSASPGAGPAAEELAISVNGRVIVNDTATKLAAAAEGLGLAYELASVARPWIEARQLEEVLADWSAATPGLYL